jgi:glucosamine-6-phosphate deaminase
MNPDPESESRDYDQHIAAAGGIDLQLLGIGRNGHIGFNEPADVFTLGTHKVTLTEDTIDFYAHYFGNSRDVPRQALTMGIGTIMQARSIVLIATGAAKASAIRDLISDRIDPRIPGSILQIHPDVTILLDREAAGQ